VYDIAGKYCRMPLYKYLGGAYRTEFPGIGGIPIGKPEDTAKGALAWIENGWVGFQMKLGGLSPDPDMDLSRVKAVRDAVGLEPIILADFNQAYRPDAAIRLLRRLERYEIYAEQPTFAYDLPGMAKIAQSVNIPIIADESLSYGQPIRNLIEMIENGGTYAIKLKSMPIGGTYTQRRLIDIAKEYELPVITDADGPVSRVTDTALAHATATLNDDLFFPTLIGQTSMLLTPDVVKGGGLTVSKGKIKVPDGPGLGLEVADWVFEPQ
jgi:L-Ala-D/L-Glu epimerase